MNTIIAASKPVVGIKALASPKAPATSVSTPFAPRPVVCHDLACANVLPVFKVSTVRRCISYLILPNPPSQAVPSKRMVTVRATETKDSVDVDKLVSDLQAKVCWEGASKGG